MCDLFHLAVQSCASEMISSIYYTLHLAPRTLTDINNHLLLLLYLLITSVRAPFLYEAQLASFEVSPLQTSDLCPSQALNF